MFDYNLKSLSPQGWQPCTRKIFDELTQREDVLAICLELRQLYDQFDEGRLLKSTFQDRKGQLKKRLPAFAFHAHFPDGKRANKTAESSGLCMIDIDNLADPHELWADILSHLMAEKGKQEAAQQSEGGRLLPSSQAGGDGWCLLLAHMTPSGHGLRLVLRIDNTLRNYPPADAIIRTQEFVRQWFISVLGKDPGIDLACKDLARISFAVPDSYILYLDDNLFVDERGESRDENLCQPAEVNDEFNAALDAAEEAQNPPSLPAVASETPPAVFEEELQFKGMAYSSIIDKYWDVMGGPPADGERNTKLHQLAYHLRYICDFNADLLRKVMPTFGLSDKEMHDLIQSALKAPRYSYSSVLKKVLGKLELESDKTYSDKDNADFADEDPPSMPSELPPLVELLTSCSPDAYKPAVAHGIFPPLATHLRDVRFRYIDNVEHEATLMCLLMAGSSAGKSCLSMPIQYLMADIRQRDEQNLLREKLWKQECTSLGANQDKPPRPEGLIIQEIDPDITNPAFVQRMKEAEPSPLYACMNEVEQFDNLRSSRGSKAQFQIMCYAFDPGNRYGQTRVGVNSVTEKVCVRFNWNASTTINKGQRYFKNVVNDGPLSRINVCTIPPAPIGAEMPVYGIYPDDFAKQLQPYLDQLCRAHGLLIIPEATNFAWRMVDRNAQISALTQNPVFEHLSFRAAVITWLKACVLYVAHGYQWDQRIEAFCQWSMDYDLWCKMRFFSQAIEEAMKNETITPWRKDNLLNKLKDTFTRYDVERARSEAGMKTPVKNILFVWKKRGFVKMNSDETYSKINFHE